MAEKKSFLLKVVDSLVPPPWEESSQTSDAAPQCRVYQTANILKTALLTRLGSLGTQDSLMQPTESKSETVVSTKFSTQTETIHPATEEGFTQPKKHLKE